MNRLFHKLLYWVLPLPLYLRVVSELLFLSIKLGFGRDSRATEYIYHLPELVAEGDVVIDIGANLGYYSRPLADVVGGKGHVYAVEPVPVICDVLRRNLGSRSNVTVHNVALGVEECEITMSNDSVARDGYFGTGQNGVGKGAESGSVEFKARMCRGSQLFEDLARLDFVKCDIEGYEMVVIPELRELLERFKPVVLIESGGENRKQIVALFDEMGYRGFTLECGVEVPLSMASNKDIIFRVRE